MSVSNGENTDSAAAQIRLSLFNGETTSTEARVYAKLSLPGQSPSGKLDGVLDGPRSPYSQTLPAKYRFTERGPGSTLLAEAVVPEPCTWTPEAPFLYRASICWRRDGGAETFEREFGIRRLGARQRSVYLDHRRWVLRGLAATEQQPIDLAVAHRDRCALLVESPSDAFCRRASQIGVMLVAACGQRGAVLRDEIARLAQWPAVGFIALDQPGLDRGDLRAACRNVLLVERLDVTSSKTELSGWADVALVDAENVVGLRALAGAEAPVFAFGKKVDYEPSAARAACDRLQARLAPLGDFAGYLVQ